ncbi:ATP-binding protein [Paenibacillus sp. FSL R7-0302]|uniref:ATP-binding protein n=1 Tax=Paenibacillus sp. FSL R7-0302 TaxID=2921681 RepID=UPI0030FC2416
MHPGIKTSEHVIIPGTTGCGKTQLAAAYLSQFPKVVKLDTKGEALTELKAGRSPWPQVHPKELTVVTKLQDLMDNHDTPYIIYNPVFDELQDEYYDVFYQWAYAHKNITVWTDEVMQVLPSPHKILKGYKAILTRGRYYDVALWQLTQRPSEIPQQCIAQATHVFCFDLPLPGDRKKMSEVCSSPQMLNRPDGHQFWYFRSGWRSSMLGVLAPPEGR